MSTFHLAAVIGGADARVRRALLGGLLIRNPRRQTSAEQCPGGQFVGAPEEAGRGAVAEPAAA